jgi:lipopolysaccharide transport system ATP-binding protein
MSDIAIRVENLSKLYRIRERRRYRTLRDAIAETFATPFRGRSQVPISPSAIRHPPSETIWALKDVSFEIKHGEVVGIIGRNGAGKSTLLKILSRITEPTEGEARIYGRVGSLLEVGTGFHPELTGRENIYLNGAILGMKKAEINRKFDEIVAFAEIEKFLDTPVKHYSTGMYMRLAFSVAAHLEPEILIVDEVLAVGDAAFQKKCLGKMGEVAEQGRTILFVSHDLGAIKTLTKRCICLGAGQVLDQGKTEDVVERYLAAVVEPARLRSNDVGFYRRDASRDSPAHVTGIRVNGEDAGIPAVELGSDLTFVVEVECDRQIQGANLTLIIKDAHGRRVAVLFSWDRDFSLFLERGKHSVEIKAHGLPLAPGQYFADIGINRSTTTKAYDAIIDLPAFKVVNNGQIVHWLDRPWGSVHWDKVEWKMLVPSASA